MCFLMSIYILTFNKHTKSGCRLTAAPEDASSHPKVQIERIRQVDKVNASMDTSLGPN